MNMKKQENSRSLSLDIKRILCYIVLVILSVACLIPFYMLFVNATRAHVDIQRGFSVIPGKFLITNISNVLNNSTILIVRGMINSLIISSLTVILSVYFSAMTAYAIHAYEFKLKNFVFNFILLIMTIPAQVSALGFIKEMNMMNLKDTFIPLIIPAIAAPACFFFMKQYMESSIPLEIVEAARIDGSNEFHTFNWVIMPMMKPALAVQAIFGFVASWNNYFTPALILTSAEKKTLPLWIAYIRSADFTKFDMGQLYMMIAFSIFPVIIIYLILSKFIVQGVTLGGVKG
ncbi:L-arabinose transport system permease protein AraQ [Anaeromicropila herbilytica]|uniref:L-arabinose transport system permease protein AraQ n=2 Tax=Anaeromicropila herbilytica TaxID=2785025 RepID=A0A7R7EIF5_9FIRM|nr:L-arabinose transport system permease protein AraQ [Anaeromicropila herbilytica]